jgi:glycosyltransferase involved in cell wall biosynthesis
MPKLSGDSFSKRTALVLAPEAPFPVVGGGPLRTASLLAWLTRRYEVDLIVFREPGMPDPRAAVPTGRFREIDVIDLPYHSKHRLAKGSRNLKRYFRGAPPLVDRFSRFDEEIKQKIGGRAYAMGIIEHSWCARYIKVLGAACERVVLDLHNIESVLLKRTAANENWATAAVLRRFAAACRRLEYRLLPEFSTILVPSEIDKAHSVQAAPNVRAIVYPNTIPFVDRPSPAKVEEIVFSGNLEYLPNLIAVRFFRDSIWPVLRERWPQLKWRLIGRNPERLRHELAGDDRIRLTGAIPDAVAEIASARAAVVPVLAGSGTRVKIIEAWAAAVPVVSTRVGAEGLPGIAGEHLLIEDEPGDFARAVSSLLEFPSLGKTLGDNGRLLYETDLTWEAAWARLDESGL